MKMFCAKGVWYIFDNGSLKKIDSSYDAWQYVLLMYQVRPHPPTIPQSAYPVRTLDPRPSMRKKKTVMI